MYGETFRAATRHTTSCKFIWLELIPVTKYFNTIVPIRCHGYGGNNYTIETHAKSLNKWAGFSLYFMLYFY